MRESKTTTKNNPIDRMVIVVMKIVGNTHSSSENTIQIVMQMAMLMKTMVNLSRTRCLD